MKHKKSHGFATLVHLRNTFVPPKAVYCFKIYVMHWSLFPYWILINHNLCKASVSTPNSKFIISQTRFWSRSFIFWVNEFVWADASHSTWRLCVCVWVSDFVTCPLVCDIVFSFRLQKFRQEDSNLYFNAKSPWRWCEFSCHPRVMVYADRTGAELTDIRVKHCLLLLDETLWIWKWVLKTFVTLSECTVCISFILIVKPATSISVETASCEGFCPL